MKYISTRGKISPIGFKEAVMMGLATDGGLLLPETLPAIDAKTLSSWKKLSYQDLAFEVMSRFIDDITASDLRSLITRSYQTFSHPQITPLVKKDGVYILELFHGPTLAFKDVALQFLGNLFEYLLAESGDRMNIVGATSGDTGSAAIQGVRGKKRINIFIMHPHKRVSPIQELQMTSVLDSNVFNIAIQGTFDDGQAIVKNIFNDIPFKEKHCLGAVNSINWARIMAQIVYYVYAYFRVSELENCQTVDFSVPTGNFGDVFAGFVARKMLGRSCIEKLVLATNDNDILSRFVTRGDYSTNQVTPTCSPSMDIQLASNFERYLYYLNGEDTKRTADDMATLSIKHCLHFDQDAMTAISNDFMALRVSETEVISTIRDFYAATGYVLDPHTAVGVKAGRQFAANRPMICLATAHPGKFCDAVAKAIGEQPLPPSLAMLQGLPTRCEILAADTTIVKEFINGHAV
ncbi:MAG: threonine synthase [Desulfobulbaceae bacterium]|nr:threonine synthase [Desulfobulbaceae bacterium]